MKKYLTKLIPLSLVILIITALFTAAVNIILTGSKKDLLEAAGNYFPEKLSARGLFFLPPNFIFLKDFSLSGITLSLQGPAARIPLIRLRVSLRELVKNRRLAVDSVYLYKPRIDYHQFYDILSENFKRIIELIKYLPLQDIKFFIREAEYAGLDDGLASWAYLKTNLNLAIRGNRVIGSGSFFRDTRRPLARGSPVQFNFRGICKNDGFTIENLEFKREDLYSDLWGSLKGGVLELSGYSFLKASFKGRNYEQAGRQRILRRMHKASLIPFDLSLVKLYIPDIDCRIDFSFPRARVDYINCTINGNPVKISGDILFSGDVFLDLALSCRLENVAAENLDEIRLKIRGNLSERAFKGNSEIAFGLKEGRAEGSTLEKCNIEFKELSLDFEKYKLIKIHAGGMDSFCLTRSNSYRISLTDFNAMVYLKNDRYKIIEFDSGFYDGLLKGQARADVSAFPVRVYSDISISGANANKLDGIAVHFSKVFGLLSSSMHFSNYPRLVLNGKMAVDNGYLNNFEFFRWLADSFSVPVLRRIDFQRASADFTVDDQGVSLQEIKLDSKDVALSGYFGLGASDMVSSKISMALSRELLSQSPKFAPLVRIIGSAPALSFNFQLSGLLHGMNFQWLRSDLKKKLQDSIPDFIERHIEKKIEEIIDSVP